MIEEPLKDEPRKQDPHTGVDDPGEKPLASDPQNRKAPLKEPPAKVPELKDPPTSGGLRDGVIIEDPNFV